MRLFFALSFSLLLTSWARAEQPKPLDPGKGTTEGNIVWYDAQLLPIEGQGFDKTALDYDRLPAEAEKVVRKAVWGLSRNSAGIATRFVTDATEIRARWTLASARLAMPHMPATGVSGMDLYVKDAKGTWRWLACGKPTKQTTTTTLIKDIPAGTREYMIYFPLYNGVKKLEIGISKDKSLFLPPARAKGKDKPLVFYGTSITHGACASRPGMVHTAILGRRLNRPVINLGFSGNGRMEPEVVNYIAQLDAEVFIFDCLPNIGAKEVAARTKPCIEIIRKAHPKTPILLVEDRSYADAFLVSKKHERNATSRAALKKVFDALKKDDPHLYYLEGDKLLGNDNEGTVDSSHPTDLGFWRHADAFEEVLKPILQKSAP